MRHSIPALTCLLAALPAFAEAPRPQPLLPEQLQWQSPPQVPGAQIGWMLGAEKAAAPYVFRVKLMPGAKAFPHTHPDERVTTVLSGTLYVGFGTVFDEATAVAIPTGAVYVAPASQPHYVWAKDGMVSYQETGIGPTGTVPVK